MIKLSKACLGIEEADLVRDVILNEQYLGMGQYVKRFEEEVATVLGLSSQHHVVAVSTGTAALHLALQALGIGPGDEVLVPTITYVASFQAIHATGARAIACDVSLNHGGLDVRDAALRITPATKAIMTVHYGGGCGDWDDIYALAHHHGLRVVEDGAHAFGSRHQGTMVGGKGDVVCFSFDSIKNITCGEGGAIVTADAAVAARSSDLRLLGIQNDTQARYLGKRSWDFDVVEQGWRYHLDNIHAAIGLAKLKKFNKMKQKRQDLMRRYYDGLREIGEVELFSLGAIEDLNPHILSIRVLSQRDKLRTYLGDHGVQTGLHYKPNHLLSFFKQDSCGKSNPFPHGEKLYEQLLTLPLHPDLEVIEVDEILGLIHGFFSS